MAENYYNDFDGVDDYIEIPHNDAQLGANLSNGFTISAWVNPRSVGEGVSTMGRILDKSTDIGTAAGFAFCVSSTNRISMVVEANGKSTENNTLALGTWQHILTTITSAGSILIYINSIVSGGAAVGAVIANITTTNAMRIGNRATATDRTFDGSIRSVKMWNRVLTTDEIAKDYAEIPVTSGLIHHFPLGNLDEKYVDKGSVGVNATNSGSIPYHIGGGGLNMDWIQYRSR